MKQISRYLISIIAILIAIHLSSCSNGTPQKIKNVGMLVDGSIQEKPWNQSGHEGMLQIKEKFNTDVFVKENVLSKHEIINAVDELSKNGVNLIFGHSKQYGKLFVDVAKMYPKIHFVYFNGGSFRDNLTSLNLSPHAMGFFSGMVAGKMTETNQVGIIASYEWQTEIEGFYEGAKFENPKTNVHIDYTNGWDENEVALNIYRDMKSKDADVYYPTGYFSEDIVDQVIRDDLYSIGYFIQEEEYNDPAILTSTVQHIDSLYVEAAEKFNEELLEGRIYFYDLSDNVITFDSFSPSVPKEFQEKMNKHMDDYKKTNLLPHEK